LRLVAESCSWAQLGEVALHLDESRSYVWRLCARSVIESPRKKLQGEQIVYIARLTLPNLLQHRAKFLPGLRLPPDHLDFCHRLSIVAPQDASIGTGGNSPAREEESVPP
jgi:hypothetical protein